MRVGRSFRVRERRNAMAASNGPGETAGPSADGEGPPAPQGLAGACTLPPDSLPGCLPWTPGGKGALAVLVKHRGGVY